MHLWPAQRPRPAARLAGESPRGHSRRRAILAQTDDAHLDRARRLVVVVVPPVGEGERRALASDLSLEHLHRSYSYRFSGAPRIARRVALLRSAGCLYLVRTSCHHVGAYSRLHVSELLLWSVHDTSRVSPSNSQRVTLGAAGGFDFFAPPLAPCAGQFDAGAVVGLYAPS